MGPQHAIFVLAAVVSLTFFLTLISLVQTHSGRHAELESSGSSGRVRSFFSFRTPSALFPSSAIISLTDDNSTFFLARPADFGPPLPSNGLSGQLWVGSGFGDDNLGRGLATDVEGELGCSDVPGWGDGKKHWHDDGTLEPSPTRQTENGAYAEIKSGKRDSLMAEQGNHNHEDEPSDGDGTDDHLHHPLPSSPVLDSSTSHTILQSKQAPEHQAVEHADIQSIQESAEISGKLVLLSRGGCGFLEKVKWVQRRGGAALIVGDNTRGGALVTMYARGDTSNVSISSLFTSRTTAHLLSSLIPPESFTSHAPLQDSAQQDQDSGDVGEKKLELGQGRSTLTSVKAYTAPSSTSRPRRPSAKTQNMKPNASRNGAKASGPGWFRSLFRSHSGTNKDRTGKGALEDSRRPPSSGQLTWINEQWMEKAIPHNEAGETRSANTHGVGGGSRAKDSRKPDSPSSSTDEFEIGIQDWRDPDLVGARPAESTGSVTGTSIHQKPTSTVLANAANGNTANKNAIKGLSGGSITPGSGEYRKSGLSQPAFAESSSDDSSEDHASQGWLGRNLWGEKADDMETGKIDYFSQHGLRVAPLPVSKATSKHRNTDPGAQSGLHEGLWVTLTPTTMSTSPFFDTLLVLVVSPLVTLTVVYSLLLIRSRIRRRRWRAPKSVVDRLPVRTYHTMSCSSTTTSSSQLATPRTSSPTSPLLQSHSRTVTSRSRPRSRTASGIGDANNQSLGTSQVVALGETLKNSNARRRYHGKQIECVVCLEEYIDGHSKVMSLPCGHEFHADCM
ncbi:MAG: hypothetical protein Q9190_001692 [Brigantiaea leucoxantha]